MVVGRGPFGPGTENKVAVMMIDLKFATNNGTDGTSKYAKFQVIGCSTFRGMTSQIFSFQTGKSHYDSIFTPWNRAKLEKITFYA